MSLYASRSIRCITVQCFACWTQWRLFPPLISVHFLPRHTHSPLQHCEAAPESLRYPSVSGMMSYLRKGSFATVSWHCLSFEAPRCLIGTSQISPTIYFCTATVVFSSNFNTSLPSILKVTFLHLNAKC